jgi:adenosylcobinamide kinase/adenosylcobinamide-phosphate guanylyltransferase
LHDVSARTFLVLGGARSGKTRRALHLACGFSHRVYLATAEALDDEMRERIALHQAERADGWQTIEAPLELVGALAGVDDPQAVVVVDCLTLWLSNLTFAERDIDAETAALMAALPHTKPAVIFVSNEIGLGLVPETRLGRQFRDAQGRLNQAVAAAVDQVEFVAAGLPIRLKPGD